MKTAKADKENHTLSRKTAKKGVNPFIKLMNDKDRIADAVENNQPLSTLKDIKFVQPI